MQIPARDWNKLVDRIGAGRIASFVESVRVIDRHAWQTSVRWHRERRAFVASIHPGNVNGEAPAVTDPETATKEELETPLVPITLDPLLTLPIDRAIEAEPTEFGIPHSTLDIVLSIPRNYSEITVELNDTGIPQIVYRFPKPSGAPTIFAVPSAAAYITQQSDDNLLFALAESNPFHIAHLATVHFYAREEDAEKIDQTWTTQVEHKVFYNLNHDTKIPDVTLLEPIELPGFGGIGLGFADEFARRVEDQLNQTGQLTAALTAREVVSRVWTI